MLSIQDTSGPVTDTAAVTFRLADQTGRLTGVRLVQELGLDQDVEFQRQGGGWELTLARPDVDRMEYLLEIVDRKGAHTTITDPSNPLQAAGVFGAKSVAEFPGYRAPTWLSAPAVPAQTLAIAIDTRAHDATITGALWAPASLAAAEPAPMLLVHDGPEYAVLGSFTQYLGAMIATGALPPMRAALLAPGDRNAWYSANPEYARALCTEVVPELERLAPATVRVGIGVSLGALALLHAHHCFPATFNGLLLQSGSFFTPQLDPQESGFSGFGAVTRFVAAVESATADPRPVPVAITCGKPEENYANNTKMADTLSRLGYRVDFHGLRDAHNYTAWRDALDLACTDLLRQLVGCDAT